MNLSPSARALLTSALVYTLSPPHYAALSTAPCALEGVASAMATLWEQWKGGRAGTLCALEQAKVWALREVMRDTEKSVNYEAIASKVVKIGVDGKKGEHPGRGAIRKLIERMDGDDEWFPGKHTEPPGRPAELSATKGKAIANTLMRMKKRGLEPSYSAALARAPAAMRNPATGEPFNKKTVYDKVFKTLCHDGDPTDPWRNQPVLSRVTVVPSVIEERLAWARRELDEKRGAGWYYRHVLWLDPQNHILPGSEKKATLQTQASKGMKRWVSNGAKQRSRNLQAPKTAKSQASAADTRVWYGLVLVRGKVHVEVFDEHFPGETGEGMALFARKLPGILRRRFRKESTPGGLPRVVFTDKGKGFYRTSPDGGWPIVKAWKAELSINIFCQFSRSYPVRHSLPGVSHVYVVGGARGGRASPLRRRPRAWPAWGHSRCHSSRDCRCVGESTAREDDPTSRVGGVEGSLR